MRKSLYDFCLELGYPAPLEEWDEEANGPLTEKVSYGSKRKYWWRCEKGHRWEAAVMSRTGERTGCPYCAGRLPIPGENDLATLYPELAAEWDGERNAPLAPGELLPGSHRHVWWRCKKGHGWRASVKSRVAGTGCPVCANRALAPGENDLATANPALAAEWDEEKNGALTPRDVFPGSSRRVWWRCGKGHSWCAPVSSRAGGAGCPYCAGKLVVPGENDLASANSRLAAEWNGERNGSLTPEQVTPYSNRRVWWRCPAGHEYQAAVSARASSGSGCPYCAGRKVLPGFNDLATVEPRIAAEWARELNGAPTPEQVTAEDGRVLNNPGSNSSVSSVFAATDADGEPVAYAYFVSGGGAYKGTVDFIVYVTPDGRIDGIEVYSSSETVSIGGKVLDDDNLAKLEGYDLTSVTDYGTIGSSAIKDEDVYITGATFTSKALMNAVRATAYAFNNYTAEAEI